MASFEVTVDPALVAAVPAARAREWASLAADLAEAVRELDARDDAWLVGFDGAAFTIAARAEDARAAIPRSELDPLFDEYLDVVGRLGASDEDGYSRVDALDMAKKVTHDRAGRVLKRTLRPLGADHEIARRAFSLFVALVHDTSARSDVHAALRPRGMV